MQGHLQPPGATYQESRMSCVLHEHLVSSDAAQKREDCAQAPAQPQAVWHHHHCNSNECNSVDLQDARIFLQLAPCTATLMLLRLSSSPDGACSLTMMALVLLLLSNFRQLCMLTLHESCKMTPLSLHLMPVSQAKPQAHRQMCLRRI